MKPLGQVSATYLVQLIPYCSSFPPCLVVCKGKGLKYKMKSWVGGRARVERGKNSGGSDPLCECTHSFTQIFI